MKTTAGIVSSLQSIAWACERRQDAKHVYVQPSKRWLQVSVLQVQAWQSLFPDQRLFGTDTGCSKATWHLKASQSKLVCCQNHDNNIEKEQ